MSNIFKNFESSPQYLCLYYDYTGSADALPPVNPSQEAAVLTADGCFYMAHSFPT